MFPLHIPEFWRPIPGWPYMASDEGRILSMTRLVSHWKTGNACIRKPKVLKPKRTQFGYEVVTLQYDKEKRHAFVHILVAEAFFGEKPKNHDVNHLNFVRHDNWIANLEYATRSENVMHSMNAGRYPDQKGEDHGAAKLKDEDVKAIRLALLSGSETASGLARKYSVSQATISMIKTRKVWTHI